VIVIQKLNNDSKSARYLDARPSSITLVYFADRRSGVKCCDRMRNEAGIKTKKYFKGKNTGKAREIGRKMNRQV